MSGRNEVKDWLSAANDSQKWPIPDIKPKILSSCLSKKVMLHSTTHLGLLLAVESLIERMNGNAKRVNLGFQAFARKAKVENDCVYLVADPNGTYLETEGFLPPWLSKTRRNSEVLLEKILHRIEKEGLTKVDS